MGVFAKLAAALVAIPAAVLGGMTTFLFAAVAASGLAVVARGGPLDRRARFILTAGLAVGYGATLVPDYFSHVFTYAGDNAHLRALCDAVVLVMQTGFFLTALVCAVLNLVLPSDRPDDDDNDNDDRPDDDGAAVARSDGDSTDRGEIRRTASLSPRDDAAVHADWITSKSAHREKAA